jgi:putative cell wall-binding protein
VPSLLSVRRRALCVLWVSAVVGVASTLGSPSRASTTFTLTRLAGADRYDTARVIAEDTFSSSRFVVMATGQDFADALAGGYAAGIDGLPILLTTTAGLPSSTADALRSLKTKGVAILGGPAAVSTAVDDELHGMGLATTRIGGSDRYQTAKLVAESAGSSHIGTVGGAPTAIVASGEDAHFPDALSASPMAFADHLPVLLTTTATLAPAAQQGLSDLGIKHVIVVGGSAAVSDTVANQIQQMGITVARLAGVDRTDTATAVADFELGSLGFSTSHVNLARGDLFPDSLSGGAHAGHESAPILLTEDPNTLGQYTSGWLSDHASALNDGHVFGGSAAVSDSTVAQAEAIVRSGSTAPPPMRLTSAAAGAGATTLSVTYSQQASCPTVASDGSDYQGSVVGGPDQGRTLSITGASCNGAADQTVALMLGNGTPAFASGDVVRIVTQQGSNGTTVRDLLGAQDFAGDSVRTTAS